MVTKAEQAKADAQVEKEEAAAERVFQHQQMGKAAAKMAVGPKVADLTVQPVTGATKGVVHDAAGRPVPDGVVPRPADPHVDADGYPIASATAGDQEAVAEAITAVRRLSDVGSCAAVLAAVVGHCQAMRVRPEVITDATKGV